MRKMATLLCALAMLTPACGGGSHERTVLVDFSSDEFASMMIDYFPAHVTVAQGDTVVFKQTWTGEPHTVTGGTLANAMMTKAGPFLPFFDAFEKLNGEGVPIPNPEDPGETTASEFFKIVEGAKDQKVAQELLRSYDGLIAVGLKLPPRANPGAAKFGDIAKVVDEESNKLGNGLPTAWDESGDDPVTQNGGQPCYLAKGTPPKDRNTSCAKSRQRQPTFTGTQSYYNSGIIPYQGPQGNTFRVKLASDIKPGRYAFYCSVHGPSQSTEIRVVPKGSSIPSQEAVSRQAREEIAAFADPETKAYHDAQDGKIDVEGNTLNAPFAGLSAPVFGSIDEFLPRKITTKVGERVTWTLMGWPHTITFDVPEYFPIIRFARDGKVSLNPQLTKPAGGSPKVPDGKPGEVLQVDGGTYDGIGFFSSALISGELYAQYSLRFSKAGTYRYACLLHPAMTGTVVVNP